MQKKIPLCVSNLNRSLTLFSPFLYVLFLANCFFLSSILLPNNLFAQQLVSGRVLDAETGDPLPSANVQIQGTFNGTITNVDGFFSMQVASLPAVLVFRYIGYESQLFEVTGIGAQNLEVALQPTVYNLDEIVVTENDPAIAIMRRVIERKIQWREELEAYSAEAYNRFTLKNDTGIVSIIESFTDTYWNPEDGMREVVKARRQTSNLEISEFLPAAQFVANLYDDDIDIAGYNFMGVTHPDALGHYIFELLGYRRIDDQLVYDISVRPRNKLKTGFIGQVAVLDGEYALLEVSLHPGEAFLFPPPIEAFDVTYKQQFSNFGGAFWLPVDFRSSMALEVGLNRLLSFPTFYIEQVSRITNYEVDARPPDTLFVEGRSVVVDSISVEEDKLLDEAGVAVPLDKAEASAYETIDSTMTLAKAYEPKGPLARVIQASARDDETGDEVQLAGERRGPRLDLDFRPHVRFNRVEGFYGELGVGKSFNKRFRLDAAVGYSTELRGDDTFSYDFGTAIDIGKEENLRLSASYARYTDTQSPSAPFLRTFNGLVVLFEGEDYYDYFRNHRFIADLRFRIPKSRVALNTGVRIESLGSLDKATDYDLFGGSFIQRENTDVSGGGVHTVVAGLTFGDSEETLGLTGREFLSFQVEHALPDFDSDYSFTRYNVEFEWRFNTFFQRRLLPNTLDVKIVGQTTSGLAPLPKLGTVDGRMSFFNQFGTLKTLQSQPYRGDDAVGLFWEHNFKTVPFEIIGMRKAAENAINLIVFGGHARTWLTDRFNTDPVLRARNWHHEIGASLSGLFSLFRVDFAVRLDEPGFTVGLGSARIF